MKSLVISKGSYSRVYEGKQQSKQFIIYDLDKYFESKWQKKNGKKCELPNLDLMLFERPKCNLIPEL